METMLQHPSITRKNLIGSAAALGGATLLGAAALAPAAQAAETPAGETDVAALQEQVSLIADQTDELASIATIKNLIAQYAISMDDCDPDLGLAACWEDSRFIYDDYFDGTGPEFVTWAMDLHLGTFVATHHDMLSTYIRFNDDRSRAVTETRALVHIVWPPEASNGVTEKPYLAIHLNRYIDTWERRDGEWRILTRTCTGDISRYEYADAPMDLYNDGSARTRGDQRFDGFLYKMLEELED